MLAALFHAERARGDSAAENPALYLYWENDTRTHTLTSRQSDRAYTNGARVALMWPTEQGGGPYGTLSWLTRWAQCPSGLEFFSRGDARAVGFAFGQNMYTPADITEPALQPNDRPYGGWTYLGALSSAGILTSSGERQPNGLFVPVSLKRLARVEVDLGVVGPASGTAETQTWVHTKLCSDCARPTGWDHQLRNELVLQLHHDVSWRKIEGFLTRPRPGGSKDREATVRYFDFVHGGGSSLGNAFVNLRGSATARLGWNLSNDMGPSANIRSVVPYKVAPGWFEAYAFTRAEPRAVARNIFLNGNTFQDSHRVPHRGLVADWELGGLVRLGPVRVMWRRIQRSPEFAQQDSPHIFGAWNLVADLPRRWLIPPSCGPCAEKAARDEF